MKKKLLKATLVVTLALLGGYNVYNSQKAKPISDLALVNIEALAEGETSIHKCISGGIYCYLYYEGNTIFESREHYITFF